MAHQRRFWHRLRLEGAAVAVSGAVAQQERLDGQEAFAATVRVAGAPSAAEGDGVDLALADLATTLGRWQLVGQLDAIDAASFPHEQVWTLVDVMAKARRARETDLELTGITDGAAVEAALTFAGIAFDPADIADAGYVLGAKTDVFWLADRTAADLIAELDALFQMRTMSLDDGRVVRVRYTLWPSTGDAVATYDRGNATVEPYLFGSQRARGRFDEIVNAVRVQGASYECGECRCQVWARAEADHPALGSGVRSRPLTISSDFVQSTGLAEAIVRDAMRRHNRLRDRVRVTTENNPDITVGKVITVRDAAAGIGLTSYRAYTVTFVDRAGNRMTLEGVGGAAGAVGAVTSGVERQCNRSTFPDFEAPDFSMPGFGAFPPVPEISVPELPGYCLECAGDEDCPDGQVCGPDGCCTAGDGGGEPATTCADCVDLLEASARLHCEVEFCPGGGDLLAPDVAPDWLNGGGVCLTPGTGGGAIGGLLTVSDGECGPHEDVALDWGEDCRLAFTVAASVPGTFFNIGLTTGTGFSTGMNLILDGSGDIVWVDTAHPASSGASSLTPLPFDPTDPFDVELERLGGTVSWSIAQGGSSWSGTVGWGTPSEALPLGLWVYVSDGSVAFTDLRVGGVPV